MDATKARRRASTTPVNDRLIPRSRALADVLGCSDSTDWRRRRADPTWPRPIRTPSGRLYYRMSDLDRFVAAQKPEQTPHGAL